MPMVNMMKNEYSPVFSTMTPCSARYLVTIDAGMPVLANLPDTSRPGVMIVALIGSSMLKPGARLPKPCHFSLARSIQSSRLPMPSARELLRAPDLEPPVLAALVVDLAHRAAEVERLDDRLLDQRGAAGRLHHRRRHVAGRDDRVLRRGRGVHQVGLVEEVPVELARLASPAPGSARPARCRPAACASTASRRSATSLAARPVLADRVHVAVELVEGGVRQPGLVEVQRVDASRRASP